MNVALSDDLMTAATGGLTTAMEQMPNYDATGEVVMHRGGRNYQVRFDDGAELIATSQSDTLVPDGTGVGLFAVAGGWSMHVLN